VAYRFTNDRIICSNMFWIRTCTMFEHPTELVLAQKRVVDHTLLQESFPRRAKLVSEACTMPICVKADFRRWAQCPSTLINQKKTKKRKTCGRARRAHPRYRRAHPWAAATAARWIYASLEPLAASEHPPLDPGTCRQILAPAHRI